MSEKFGKWLALILVVAILTSLAGCGAEKKSVEGAEAALKAENHDAGGMKNTVDGLPKNFPAEVPFYKGAKVIEADNFNGNNYTVVYSANADYNEIVAFYEDAFDLDSSDAGDGEAYYEGLDFGDVFIKGLTIEDAGDAVNVYMTLEDNSQGMEGKTYSGSEDLPDGYVDGTAGSDVMTYETAEEVSLDSGYPQNVVPIPDGAKIVDCSMVPGMQSGFLDLILPGEDFETTVMFYTDTLGLTPKISTTSVQEAASFKGEISGIKTAVLVSHLLGGGHDTLVQITVDEK